MKSVLQGIVYFCCLSVISAELCYYYDDFADKFRSITCYTGCCDDVCCDAYDDYYWSAGSIAGATVGSIIAMIFIVVIIVVSIRVCCNGGRSRGRIVYARQVDTQGVSVVHSSSAIVNNVATPQMVYPQQLAPPPYTEANAHVNLPRY